MFCPKCGNQTDDDADFCSKCGNELKAARALHDAADPEPAGADAPAPVREPEPPTAPMPMAETVPMAAAADAEAQAQYREQMAQYERDMAAWQAQHGRGADAGAGGEAGGAAAPTVTVPLASGDDGTPPARKSRAGLIVGLVLAFLLLCGCLAVAGSIGFVWYSNDQLSKALDVTPQLNSLLQAQDDTSSVAATTPEKTVDAFYLAVSNGELSTLRSLSTTGFGAGIDASMFEGRDPNTNYRIVGVRTRGDQATVDVFESSGDGPARPGVSFQLARQPDGTWLVSAIATNSLPPNNIQPGVVRPVLTKTLAVDVVGRYLEAQKNGDHGAMKALSTQHMQDVHSEQFQGSAKEAFISFEVTRAAQKPDQTWVITTKESWISGMETPSYYVVMQNGKALVNDQTWPQ